MKTFDYVIAGAGAAGCVLAYRLSENPAISVALIEAGGSHDHPFIHMPKGIVKAMADAARLYVYSAEPEDGNAHKPEFWVRGRVMGGSSTVNGMMYVRGQPEDFDEIAAMSSDDWSWKHIKDCYRAMENHELGAGKTRGDKGPLNISLPDRKSALTDAMVDAGVAMGLKRRNDSNEPDGGEAIAYAARTIYQGKRVSAATAFIDPIRHRPNLTVISGAMVDKINFEGRRAKSVTVLMTATKQSETITANREILIAGGAMASPGILQRSGIGPAKLLGDLGIPVVQDSPDVGQKLLEHRGIIAQWKLNNGLSDNNQFSGWRLVKNVIQYFLTSKGPMTGATYEIGAWFKSRPEVKRPDIQFLVAPYSFDFAANRMKLETFPGMTIVGYPLRPTSHGEINIKTTDPTVLPVLKPHYRSTDHDRQLMIETIKTARRYTAQKPLCDMIEVETFPGPRCKTDDEIIDAFDKDGTCGYHAVGSCRMGSDAGSVVDPQCRVRGVDGLRVIDTSIMPQIPAGNTNGPTMAMAWRAVDIIRRDSK